MIRNLLHKIIHIFNVLYFVWNYLLWNYHVSLARMHDFRLKKADPKWRENL